MAKTTRRVRVALGEALHPVGEIVFEADGRRETCMFRYAPEWLDDPARFAIAPTMPLAGTPFYTGASRERRRSALPGPIADGAPDSWGRGLIRKALSGVLTELDYLLAATTRPVRAPSAIWTRRVGHWRGSTLRFRVWPIWTSCGA